MECELHLNKTIFLKEKGRKCWGEGKEGRKEEREGGRKKGWKEGRFCWP